MKIKNIDSIAITEILKKENVCKLSFYDDYRSFIKKVLISFNGQFETIENQNLKEIIENIETKFDKKVCNIFKNRDKQEYYIIFF